MFSIRYITQAALMASLAMVLSLIPDIAGWFTPSWGALVLIAFSLKAGSRYGLLAGFLWGLLHLLLGKAYILNLSQTFIEYLLAFTSMGLAGIFNQQVKTALKIKQTKKALLWTYLSSALAILVRYFWHFLAGGLFWADYAPEGTSPYLYSLSVNSLTAGLTFIVCLGFLTVFIQKNASYFIN